MNVEIILSIYEINPHRNTSSSAKNVAILSKMCSPELGKKGKKRKKNNSIEHYRVVQLK